MKKFILVTVIGLLTSSASLAASYTCTRSLSRDPGGILVVDGSKLSFKNFGAPSFRALTLINGWIFDENGWGGLQRPVGTLRTNEQGMLILNLNSDPQMDCR